MKTLTTTELQGYRSKLLALTARVGGGVDELRDEARQPAADAAREPTLDGGAAGGPVTLELLGAETRLLAEMTAALGRLDRGTFGTCEVCGKAIARARLDALPYARACGRCARATG